MDLALTPWRRLRFLWARIVAFVRPVPGWKARLAAYRAGRAVWPFPQAPEIGNIGPWPPEWTPYTLETGDKIRVVFTEHHSRLSGRWCAGQDAVLCARCGIALHALEAGMENNLDAPVCPWCVSVAS